MIGTGCCRKRHVENKEKTLNNSKYVPEKQKESVRGLKDKV